MNFENNDIFCQIGTPSNNISITKIDKLMALILILIIIVSITHFYFSLVLTN